MNDNNQNRLLTDPFTRPGHWHDTELPHEIFEFAFWGASPEEHYLAGMKAITVHYRAGKTIGRMICCTRDGLVGFSSDFIGSPSGDRAPGVDGFHPNGERRGGATADDRC